MSLWLAKIDFLYFIDGDGPLDIYHQLTIPQDPQRVKAIAFQSSNS